MGIACAVLDWHTRRVLTWRLSNTLTTDFCIEAVQEAIERPGRPEIFNTDQGCQFTSEDSTALLRQHGIQTSMDGKGASGAVTGQEHRAALTRDRPDCDAPLLAPNAVLSRRRQGRHGWNEEPHRRSA